MPPIKVPPNFPPQCNPNGFNAVQSHVTTLQGRTPATCEQPAASQATSHSKSNDWSQGGHSEIDTMHLNHWQAMAQQPPPGGAVQQFWPQPPVNQPLFLASPSLGAQTERSMSDTGYPYKPEIRNPYLSSVGTEMYRFFSSQPMEPLQSFDATLWGQPEFIHRNTTAVAEHERQKLSHFVSPPVGDDLSAGERFCSVAATTEMNQSFEPAQPQYRFDFASQFGRVRRKEQSALPIQADSAEESPYYPRQGMMAGSFSTPTSRKDQFTAALEVQKKEGIMDVIRKW